MNSIVKFLVVLTTALLLTAFAIPADGQTRKRRPASKPPVKKDAAETVKVEPPVAKSELAPLKRNERPEKGADVEVDGPTAMKAQISTTSYRYEFSQPDFLIRTIVIEHNEAGNGTISFNRQNDEESVTESIKLSAATLERINRAIAALNYLDSTENYQHAKDFSHLGNIKFLLTREGRSREILINWTENKEMRTIMGEYRKIGHQFIWIFDISVSRENQPLESPKLMRSLDSMIARNEISDPLQLEPLLNELSNDERLPLIARNHAVRIVKQIEKIKQKAAK